jgi:uncharacterized membrane protein YkvA (DUF1232 family)
MQPAPDFAEQLEAYVADYRGPREVSIREAANLYRFYVRLYADPRLPRAARPIVNAVLAYFVVADDVIPHDEHGALGLVDDVYLAAHAYRLLCSEGVEDDLLRAAWPARTDVEAVMNEVYRDARSEVGKKRKDVLRMSGLG